MKFRKKYNVINVSIIFIVVILILIVFCVANYYNLLPKRTYTGDDFGIAALYSKVDFNDNGLDDYTDILNGAKIDAENHPKYNASYYVGGYPPDNIGVCTDVIWRAFKNAGYDLREMVDKDITLRPEAYPSITQKDKNIDFRRVVNLHIFLKKYAISLTIDTEDISQWQAGDIVIFDNDKHIGIVSDKRNKKGQPYIIHNSGQPNREEDYLKRGVVTGHYRFDASLIDDSILIRWAE